jgi:hypothetical protein
MKTKLHKLRSMSSLKIYFGSSIFEAILDQRVYKNKKSIGAYSVFFFNDSTLFCTKNNLTFFFFGE